MKRRRLLAVVGAGSMGSLSGCAIALDALDDSEDEGSDIPTPVDVDGSESPEPTETPNSDAEGVTINQPDSGDGSGGSESDDRESSGPEVETPEDRQERERIFELYNDGIGQLNDGVRAREAAVGAWNNERYGLAISEARSARESFDEARTTFEGALNIGFEIGHTEAVNICTRAVKHATLLRDAMRQLVTAVELAEDGRTERANERLDTVRELETEADGVAPPDGDVILSVLDLD